MSTRRHPIKRALRGRITPAALAAFERMEDARRRCTCQADLCAACDEYWTAHAQLHAALGLLPHQWPAFEYPDAECPFPAASYAAQYWKQRRDERPEAFAIYEALKEAARSVASWA